MAKIYLIRHGRAAASFGEHRDPGLDELGRAQALQVAETVARRSPAPIVTSPLLRCRETAAPLAARWRREVEICAAVRELPSPIADLAGRSAWLEQMRGGSWREADERDGDLLRPWRHELIQTLKTFHEDAVVFSHFIAINVAVGAALGSDAVINFHPDNGSITIIDQTGGRIELVELGRQSETVLFELDGPSAS